MRRESVLLYTVHHKHSFVFIEEYDDLSVLWHMHPPRAKKLNARKIFRAKAFRRALGVLK